MSLEKVPLWVWCLLLVVTMIAVVIIKSPQADLLAEDAHLRQRQSESPLFAHMVGDDRPMTAAHALRPTVMRSGPGDNYPVVANLGEDENIMLSAKGPGARPKNQQTYERAGNWFAAFTIVVTGKGSGNPMQERFAGASGWVLGSDFQAGRSSTTKFFGQFLQRKLEPHGLDVVFRMITGFIPIILLVWVACETVAAWKAGSSDFQPAFIHCLLFIISLGATGALTRLCWNHYAVAYRDFSAASPAGSSMVFGAFGTIFLLVFPGTLLLCHKVLHHFGEPPAFADSRIFACVNIALVIVPYVGTGIFHFWHLPNLVGEMVSLFGFHSILLELGVLTYGGFVAVKSLFGSH